MNKTWLCLFLMIFGINSAFSQSISKTWQLHSDVDSTQQALFSPNSLFNLDEGRFEIIDETSEENLVEGDYIYQNNLLIIFANKPKDEHKYISYKFKNALNKGNL